MTKKVPPLYNNKRHWPVTIIVAICCLLAFGPSLSCLASPDNRQFTDIVIDLPFRDLLLNNPDFMTEGGAKLIKTENGALALTGIGKVFPDSPQGVATPDDRRKGEMLARAAILNLTGPIEITTARGAGQSSSRYRNHSKIHLFSFLQATAAKLQGEIKQLPVIGSWWSANQQTFYVAVGKIVRTPNRPAVDLFNHASLIRNEKNSGVTTSSGNSALLIEGEEPFVSILKALPVLVKNGGVRGVLLPDGRKALLAVANIPVQGNKAKALRIARMKAIRNLLGHQEGIHVVSAEYLTDGEHLQLSESGEQYFSVSEFLFVQQEHVSGKITALPVVAEWENKKSEVIGVAVGEYR